ncbi:hypothetical protein GDO86_009172 [Hymenochirus boettgeri]|uniref:Uncharacterized protein n=1 Tax=Hymenochirus boettgeri TaxID=247094 RepID=A0A8T2JEX3_9PIPI|nr:hypothetical protein GDO86_009172 [Hymenochirus boettgeri]
MRYHAIQYEQNLQGHDPCGARTSSLQTISHNNPPPQPVTTAQYWVFWMYQKGIVCLKQTIHWTIPPDRILDPFIMIGLNGILST